MSQTSKQQFVDFDTLNGLKGLLYYNNHACQFQLGQVVFQVNEDEQDGYRSCLRDVEILSTDARTRPGDFMAEIVITKSTVPDRDSWEFVDTKTGHIWLEFGTDNVDDYYPSFIFYFYPVDPNKT
jgi:hypothetical protein